MMICKTVLQQLACGLLLAAVAHAQPGHAVWVANADQKVNGVGDTSDFDTGDTLEHSADFSFNSPAGGKTYNITCTIELMDSDTQQVVSSFSALKTVGPGESYSKTLSFAPFTAGTAQAYSVTAELTYVETTPPGTTTLVSVSAGYDFTNMFNP